MALGGHVGPLGADFGLPDCASWGVFWGPFGAHFGPPGGHSWPLGLLGLILGLPEAILGLRRGGVPAEAKKGPKMLKTAQNSLKTCFFSLLGPPGRPQNSSHSIISGGEKRYFLAFGCDFEGKKCLEQRKTRGFEVSGKAETLYFAIDLNGQMGETKQEFLEKSGAGIRKT